MGTVVHYGIGISYHATLSLGENLFVSVYCNSRSAICTHYGNSGGGEK